MCFYTGEVCPLAAKVGHQQTSSSGKAEKTLLLKPLLAGRSCHAIGSAWSLGAWMEGYKKTGDLALKLFVSTASSLSAIDF